MTTVLAVYEGGVLRPAHPLPLAEGETVEITVAKPRPMSDEWQRRLRAATSVQEWVALANANPNPAPDFDIGRAVNESRQQTGFRLPDPDPEQEGSP